MTEGRGPIKGLRRKGVGRPFWALLRTQLKVEYGAQKLAESLNLGQKRGRTYLYLGLIALAFLPLLALMFKVGTVLAEQCTALGQPGLPVLLAVMAGQAMVLLVGISGLMSTLYYSDDLESLQAMPLLPGHIILAKVASVYAAQLVFSTLAAAPFLIPLGIQLGGLGYWLRAALVNLAVPALPLAVGLLGVVLIMRFTGRSKKRDFFRVVLGLFALVFVMGFQVLNMNMTKHGPQAILESLLQKDGVVQLIARNYPPLKWAADALTGRTPGAMALDLGLFVGGSVGLLLLLSYVSQIWFFGGITRDVPATSEKKRKAASKGFVAKARSPELSIMMQEHRVLTRTPGFLLVALSNLLVVPIILVVSVFGTGSGSELPQLVSTLRVGGAWDLILLGVVGIHGALVGLNQIASTAVTREGGNFWFSKTIPLKPSRQVRGKLWYSMAFAGAQMLVFLPVVGYLLRPAWYELVLIALLGTLVSWPVSQICLINDLFHPKLKWSQPQQALKGNFYTLVAWLFSIVYLALFGFLVRFARKACACLSGLWLYLPLALLVAASGLLLQRWLGGVADLRYREIEV